VLDIFLGALLCLVALLFAQDSHAIRDIGDVVVMVSAALCGVASLFAGVTTTLYKHISYPTIRKGRLVVVVFELLMFVAGVFTTLQSSRHSGDWGAYNALGGMIFIAFAVLLLLWSWFELWFVKRIGPDNR
jgi:hypothetical protein